MSLNAKRRKLLGGAAAVAGTGMADIAKRLETEFRVWPEVVKAANIKVSRE